MSGEIKKVIRDCEKCTHYKILPFPHEGGCEKWECSFEPKECCEKCVYYHRLKHNFNKGFEESHACDVLLHIDDGGEGWIQEVYPKGMCEMFTERKDQCQH